MIDSNPPQTPGGISPGNCPLCGGANGCPLASGQVYRGRCWCESIDMPDHLLARVPEAARRVTCICRSCVNQALPIPDRPELNSDYYLDPDTGFQVFTEEYHRRRGHCCHSGCRHCPWPRRASHTGRSLVALLSLLFIYAVTGFKYSSAKANTWTEDFSVSPDARGWTAYGDASLFRWRPNPGELQVTWDTSHHQSFFVHPLGCILTTQDDFDLSLDLRLDLIQPGLRPNRPGAMQISLGWLNLSNALAGNYPRAGGRGQELLEWDWFPSGFIPGYGDVEPTLSPIAFDDRGQVSASFTFPFDLVTNIPYRLHLAYAATNRQMSVALDVAGLPGPPIYALSLDDSFGTFHLDAFAVMIWNELASPFDSLVAVGAIDNLVFTYPPSPIDQISWVGGSPSQVQFLSHIGWTYTLQATDNLMNWVSVTDPIPGTGKLLVLADTRSGLLPHQFYRVSANRK